MHRQRLNGKVLGVLAALLALFMAAGAAGEGEERTDASGQWTYMLEEVGAMILWSVEEPSGDLVIPHTLDGHAVRRIGGGAFLIDYVLAQPPAATATPDHEIFARIGGNTFDFSSGVGGWSTEVVVSEDGSFAGYFHDWDLGDTGEDYPEGTRYECTFSGVFAVTGKIDPYTYELRLVTLEREGSNGEERIVDGVRVIGGDAYGIEGGDVFMLYFPGRETADLPEAFLEWIRMPNAWEEVPGALPFYGLYNVKAETGFFAYAER